MALQIILQFAHGYSMAAAPLGKAGLAMCLPLAQQQSSSNFARQWQPSFLAQATAVQPEPRISSSQPILNSSVDSSCPNCIFSENQPQLLQDSAAVAYLQLIAKPSHHQLPAAAVTAATRLRPPGRAPPTC